MPAPIVVIRGEHCRDFDLLAHRGGVLGSVATLRKRAYEFRDIAGERLFTVQDVGPDWRSFGLTKWRLRDRTARDVKSG
jgi:hypothetical protein